jgi:hypothetical protein
MDGALGGRVKTDKLKLSDFIDESFFEDVEMAIVKAPAQKKKQELR